MKSGLCHPGLPSSSRPVNTLQSAKSVASPFNISHSPRRYIQIDMKINYINNIEYLNKRRQGSCWSTNCLVQWSFGKLQPDVFDWLEAAATFQPGIPPAV